MGFNYRMSQRRSLGKVIYNGIEKLLNLHKKGYFEDLKNYHKLEDK
jgi:hypothetical protein